MFGGEVDGLRHGQAVARRKCWDTRHISVRSSAVDTLTRTKSVASVSVPPPRHRIQSTCREDKKRRLIERRIHNGDCPQSASALKLLALEVVRAPSHSGPLTSRATVTKEKGRGCGHFIRGRIVFFAGCYPPEESIVPVPAVAARASFRSPAALRRAPHARRNPGMPVTYKGTDKPR